MSRSSDKSYISLTSSVMSWRDVRRHALILHIWITFCWIAGPQKLWNLHKARCSRMCSSIDRSYIGLTSSVKSWRHVRRHALILHIWITFCWIAWPQKLWNLHKARCSRISGSWDRCIASLTSCMTTWLYVIALTLVIQFSNVSHKIEVNCCFEKFFKLCIAKAS